MQSDRVLALILAAGFSARMGEFKPLMPLNGKPVIERSINSFQEAGVNDIRVVVGCQAEELLPVLSNLGVMPVLNENYQLGMFSSVQAGLHTFTDDIDGFFLLPGDMPLVKKRTLEKMIEAFKKNESYVVFPRFLSQAGHPPLISRKCFDRILAEDSSGNLKSVLKEFKELSFYVEVADQAICMDMDTPEDYQRLNDYCLHSKAPTWDECQAIYNIYKVPDSTVEHCRTVAKTARNLAESLNKLAGFRLDLNLVMTGGLLHDIARKRPNHARAGADILTREGFPEVAGVVAAHMDIKVIDTDSDINEAAIVYLADKLVKDNQVVDIEERFKAVMRCYSAEPEISEKILERMNNAMIIKRRIEHYLSIDELLHI